MTVSQPAGIFLQSHASNVSSFSLLYFKYDLEFTFSKKTKKQGRLKRAIWAARQGGSSSEYRALCLVIFYQRFYARQDIPRREERYAA